MAVDPYRLLGIRSRGQAPDHYRLLGLDTFESDEELIEAAANRQMVYLHELASGDNAAASQRLMNEVSQARLCLLNPTTRAVYDAKLRVKLQNSANPPERHLPSPVTPPPIPPPAPDNSPTPPLAPPSAADAPWTLPDFDDEYWVKYGQSRQANSPRDVSPLPEPSPEGTQLLNSLAKVGGTIFALVLGPLTLAFLCMYFLPRIVAIPLVVLCWTPLYLCVFWYRSPETGRINFTAFWSDMGLFFSTLFRGGNE